MAQGNFRDFLKGDEVLRKKYLYVLRPVVAILWIESGRGVVPTMFQTAVDAVVEDPSVRDAIASLLNDKRAGREMDYGPKVPVLSDFIEHELDRLQSAPAAIPGSLADWEPLNRLFRRALTVAWRQDV